MRNSDFDRDSLYIGLFIGCLLGVIITALAVNFDTGKQKQTECKLSDGIQMIAEQFKEAK